CGTHWNSPSTSIPRRHSSRSRRRARVSIPTRNCVPAAAWARSECLLAKEQTVGIVRGLLAKSPRASGAHSDAALDVGRDSLNAVHDWRFGACSVAFDNAVMRRAHGGACKNIELAVSFGIHRGHGRADVELQIIGKK